MTKPQETFFQEIQAAQQIRQFREAQNSERATIREDNRKEFEASHHRIPVEIQICSAFLIVLFIAIYLEKTKESKRHGLHQNKF